MVKLEHQCNPFMFSVITFLVYLSNEILRKCLSNQGKESYVRWILGDVSHWWTNEGRGQTKNNPKDRQKKDQKIPSVPIPNYVYQDLYLEQAWGWCWQLSTCDWTTHITQLDSVKNWNYLVVQVAGMQWRVLHGLDAAIRADFGNMHYYFAVMESGLCGVSLPSGELTFVGILTSPRMKAQQMQFSLLDRWVDVIWFWVSPSSCWGW